MKAASIYYISTIFFLTGNVCVLSVRVQKVVLTKIPLQFPPPQPSPIFYKTIYFQGRRPVEARIRWNFHLFDSDGSGTGLCSTKAAVNLCYSRMPQ